MKLIFLNRFFYPDHSATSQILSDLAFALAERGHEVQVITSRLCYDGSRKLKSREIVRGINIIRVPTSSFGRNNLLGRALDYGTFFLSAGFALIWQAQPGDLVIAKTDPPLLSVVAAPVARMRGARSINWLQDLFPEVATALGLGQRRAQKLVISLLQWLRDVTLRQADANVVLGKRMAARLKERGVAGERIITIPNWADGSGIVPVEPSVNALRRQWGLHDAFVVGYSGNLGRAHNFETVLAAIAELEAREELARKGLLLAATDNRDWQDGSGESDFSGLPIRWLFVGGGAEMELLRHEVKKGGYRSVFFKPYQPRTRLAESLSVPDVHLISLRPELEGLIVPSKYYGIAAAGRPSIFIGDPDGELACMIRENGTGFVIREGDDATLAGAILTLARDPALRAKQGAHARRLFEEEYGLSHAIAAWETLIENVSPKAQNTGGQRFLLQRT